MYYKCVKFHKNPISGLEGVALTRYMDGRTDGRTDRVIPIYPPNFVCRGIKSKTALVDNVIYDIAYIFGGLRGCGHMVVGFPLPMQSVPFTTDVVSSNPAQGDVYNFM